MAWIYRLIAIALAVGIIDYIWREKKAERQIMAGMVLVPFILRILMIR